MIGRGPLRVSHVLAVTALTAGFVWAGFATHPRPAIASASQAVVARAQRHAVTFEWDGVVTQEQSGAPTVGDFLRERNIVVGDRDYVDPAADVPLSDGMIVTYRESVPVTISTAKQQLTVQSSARDVGTLLQDEGVQVGVSDDVQPSLADPVPANGVVRVSHVTTWQRTEIRTIAEQTIHKIDFAVTPGSSKVVSAGRAGRRQVVVVFTQRDGGPIASHIVSSRILSKPRPRVVLDGVDEYSAFANFEAHGVARSVYIADSAMEMIATAYTAGCAGCSGITALGLPAGHGIVAVDPSVIPLGTRLYIPGYGPALAGDTGGAIHGNRIDLGFNSERDAMLFGRRPITVYRLK